MFLVQILCSLFEILTLLTYREGLVKNGMVAGQPGEARSSELKCKAEKITHSYSEMFAILKSGNSSQAETVHCLDKLTIII